MEVYESEGRTVEEAVEKICKKFNVAERDLHIEVVSNNHTGWRFFGLGGAKQVRVQATKKIPEEEKHADRVKEILNRILELLGIPSEVQICEESQREIRLNLSGEHCGLLIGRNGEVLDALQYIVNKIASKASDFRKRVIIDAEGYRTRKVERLTKLAFRLAERVKKTQKPVTMNPMNAHDRRIVHVALQDDPMITTISQGEGFFKNVLILPRKGNVS